MDKKTLIRLAQPAATFALALSIISIPLIAHAGIESAIRYHTEGTALRVYHLNSCN